MLNSNDANILVLALLRRRGDEFGNEVYLDREVEVSKDITVPSTDGQSLNFTLAAAIRHVDHFRTGKSGHFYCHLLTEQGIFYKSDSTKPLVQSEPSDIRKCTHFIFHRVVAKDEDYV